MDELNLSPEEERELREALDGAPDGLKDAFCKCWPAVKNLLEWLHNRPLPPKVKQAIERIIKAGDWISGKVCPQ